MLPGSVTFRARACAVTTAGVRVQSSELSPAVMKSPS